MSSSTTATRTKFVFEPHPTPSVAVLGDDGELKFPVHRIYCVGRNYADHVKEMGGDSNLDKPVFFCKPADAVVVSGTSIPYPLATKNLHYEAELVIALQSGGKSIPVDQALKHVYGYAVGIDLTRRDLQAIAKEKGQPWDSAKAFDLSAPIGPITVGPNSVKDDAKISLEVNKVQKQSSTIDKMIYSIPEIISILSEEFLLQAGDLIFTGKSIRILFAFFC